jgi:hypothetical protein
MSRTIKGIPSPLKRGEIINPSPPEGEGKGEGGIHGKD